MEQILFELVWYRTTSSTTCATSSANPAGATRPTAAARGVAVRLRHGRREGHVHGSCPWISWATIIAVRSRLPLTTLIQSSYNHMIDTSKPPQYSRLTPVIRPYDLYCGVGPVVGGIGFGANAGEMRDRSPPTVSTVGISAQEFATGSVVSLRPVSQNCLLQVRIHHHCRLYPPSLLP